MGLRPLDTAVLDDRAIHPVLPIRPQQDMTVTPPPSLVIFWLCLASSENPFSLSSPQLTPLASR